MPLLSANRMWEAFATRALFYASYGGADFGECQATMARIGDDGDEDAWYSEWSATADRLAEAAATSEAGEHHVSAREAYVRAANYYRTSFQPLFGAPVDPRLRAAFEKGAEALASAVRLADPPAEMVEIPFEGGSLPGVLAEPRGGEARGTIVYTNGYDSDISEMYVAHVPAAIERGYRILIFDGPGQGRNLVRDGIPIRGNWESVVGPVIDWVVEQPSVDPDRIVLAGWSFGGFLAPRAAAFEPRLAALIADPGQWDQRDAIVGRLPLTDEQKKEFPDIDPHALNAMEDQLSGPDGDPMLRWSLLDRGRWVHDKPTLFEMLAELASFRLSDVADRIACPVLLTAAEEDPVARSAATLYEALTVERRALVEFTGAEGAGQHCEANGRRLYHQRIYDWLDETLA